MAEETNTDSYRGLRRLRGELDFGDWGFAAQAKLGKKNVWHVVAAPRPERREVLVSQQELEAEEKRRRGGTDPLGPVHLRGRP